jgi:hypothetical protein
MMIAGAWSVQRVQAASGMQTAPKATTLGSIQIPRKVMADGKPLAAGTYSVRLSPDMPSAVVGQTPEEARWVEFVQGGAVKGREIATVLTKDETKQISKGDTPASGTDSVELLKGNDYLRVWINHAGTSYLVHLVVPAK